MALTEALFVIAGLLAAVYMWAKHNFSYWQRKGIPFVKPTLFIGNTKEMFKMENSYGMHISEIYSDPAMQNEAVVGVYTLNKPSLIIRDTDLLKSVLIKDFNKFSNRYGRADPHDDALGAKNLFFVRNPEWKDLRSKLTPVFTSGKLKQMYPLMLEVASELESHLTRKVGSAKKFSTEIREICALFTTDMIATIAFGIRANSLQDPNAEFRRQGRKHFNFSLLRGFEFFVSFFFPKMVTILKVKIFTKEFSKFLRDSINFVMKEREQSGSIRNDLIDILIGLKKEAALEQEKHHYAKEKDFLVAQAAIFFTAGFETSSSTMSFALYELSKKPELQKRLREEIHEALIAENGKLSYEKIHALEYLSMVVDETLRLYPVLPFLDRVYEDTAKNQKFSLKPHYNFELEQGTPVFIPVYGLQHDAKYWPIPENFDPERFSPENKKNINAMAYMPFGTGPHNCIGSRIGLLQSKIGLVHFLKNHFIQPCDQTIPAIDFDPKAFILQSKTGIHLEVTYDGLYDNRVATN